MIRIPCRVCKFELELPEELAGTEYQCPQCHLLNDVPTLHELKQIHEDGTYVLSDRDLSDNPDRLSDLIYVFAKDKTDHQGNEIDLRGPIAGEENSYKLADEPPPELRPKYDPETGELIQALEVVQDPSRQRIDPASIPMAQPALGYATATAIRAVSTRSAFFSLLRPANALVWNLVFFLYFAAALILLACGYLGYIIGVCFVFIFMMMLIAHWACVIDEIGREERDELPRPFRDLQWYDDMAQPLFALALALCICYLPERLAATWITNVKVSVPVRLVLGLAGTYFFPAAFLTAATSGSIVNLRPDRIWGTAISAGGSYALAVLLWTPAGLLYAYSLMLMLVLGMPNGAQLPKWVQGSRALIPLGILYASIYLMHYFCWILALIYREHHANFPWAFQFHKRRRDQGLGEARNKNRTNKRQPGIQPQRLKPMLQSPAALPKPAAPLPQASGEQWPEIKE